MFGKWDRRFAYGYEGEPGDWEPGPPPPHHWGPQHHHHHHHEEHRCGPGAHFFSRAGGRRGPFGPGGPFGPQGPFRGEGRRFFGRGDVKYALLELLQERPLHGYEMIKILEERSGGFYTPSAGTIYPTLQLLEDRGLVTSQEVDGKKVYKITDEGQKFLAERKQDGNEFGPPWRRPGGPGGPGGPGQRWAEPEFQALRAEAAEVIKLFAIAGRSSFRDPQKMERLRTILENARKELNDFIYSDKATQENTEAPHTEPEPPAE